MNLKFIDCFLLFAVTDAAGITRQEFSHLLTSEADTEFGVMGLQEADSTWSNGKLSMLNELLAVSYIMFN